MLQNIEGPFGIISVAGMYRTGKSYLLNKILLDRKPGETGFQVGPSVNPCTKVSIFLKLPQDLNFNYRVCGFGEDHNADLTQKAIQSTYLSLTLKE